MKKLLRGLIKACIVVLCFAATYLVGYLNPGIVALKVNGIEVTVMTGIQLVVLVGYYHYAKQVIEKLTAIVKGNISIDEADLIKNGIKSFLQSTPESHDPEGYSITEALENEHADDTDPDDSCKKVVYRINGTITVYIKQDDR